MLRRLAWSALAVAIAAVGWLILPLRLANPELNHAVALGAIWVVFGGFCIAGAILPGRIWVRGIVAAAFGLLAIDYSLLLIVGMIAGGPLKGFEVVDSIKLPTSDVMAYRTNGGATTPYGILISHQRVLLPGVVLVRDLHEGHHESSAKLTLSQSDTVRATISGRAPNQRSVEEYKLRRFIVF